MHIHAISTGAVQITQSWRIGRGPGPLRIVNTLLDQHVTEWLPIYCYVIEHPEGLIVVDTGMSVAATIPRLVSPLAPLMQRAVHFRITAEDELGPQLQAHGMQPGDVRWVVITHLHQDHDRGLPFFPQAEVLVSRREWQAAQGWQGRMVGYMNQDWPAWLAPTCVDFSVAHEGAFPSRYHLTRRGDVQLIPTPGHSAGHMSVLVEDGQEQICIAGDAAYTQDLLLSQTLDGVGIDPRAQHATLQELVRLLAERPTIFLPTHEWDAGRRLQQREPARLAASSQIEQLAAV